MSELQASQAFSTDLGSPRVPCAYLLRVAFRQLRLPIHLQIGRVEWSHWQPEIERPRDGVSMTSQRCEDVM
jgi:hypothetical protein